MKIIILITTVLLSSCTTTRFVGTSIGSEAFDETLIISETGVCDLSSSGSIRRRYNTEERFKIWQDFCAMIQEIRQ